MSLSAGTLKNSYLKIIVFVSKSILNIFQKHIFQLLFL